MLALVVLACATPALGSGSLPPWSGGASRTSAFERSVTRIARSLAGGHVAVECVDRGSWRALAGSTGFDPVTTWGMTPLARDTTDGVAYPEGRTRLSPRTCALASAFASAPTERGSRICRHGTTTRWTAVSSGRRRPLRTPLLGECDAWGSTLVAVHVLGHESMHLAGVVGEAAADCLAMQLDAFVAERLGATAWFARSLAREYWELYYPAQDALYRSAACRDGGALDLFPHRVGWPTPSAYPDDVARTVGTFIAATGARPA